MKVNDNNLFNATILMIDDEPILMEMVKIFLEEDGYSRFHLEEDSKRAMQTLEDVAPDILLLDLVMPEVTGFDILKAVREHQRFKHLPVIILTGSTDTESKLRALDLGATDLLAKPVDQSELRLRVRNTLAAKAYTDQLAYYDALTKLPNKQMFQEHFEWALKKASRYNEEMALINVAIDDFGRINATLGPSGGDQILFQIARRIEKMVRDVDMIGHFISEDSSSMNVFRTDGGAFLLLLERLQDSSAAAIIAQRLLKAISKPIIIDESELYLTASIGIAAFPHEGNDCTSLQSLANSAGNYAKKRGGNSIQFSSKEINSIYEERLNLENSVRKGINNNEFVLYYQPKVDVRRGIIQGVEALLRWHKDGKHIVGPDEFISLAEETGLIVPLGNWVLTEACSQLAAWHKAGNNDLTMNVNLSPKQFQHKDFFSETERIIKESGIDPCFLTLEITESLLVDDVDVKIEQLQRLKNLGVQLSIDDFGTGYSSLSYLRQLPLNELKIDRSFIKDVPEKNDSCAIVSTVIYLAKKLGLKTIAEGIETEEQLIFLENERCHQYQGFLYSRALPAEELYEQFLRKN